MSSHASGQNPSYCHAGVQIPDLPVFEDLLPPYRLYWPKLTVFLSSIHEWPMTQVVIKRGLILTKDVFLVACYLKWRMQSCVTELGDGKEPFRFDQVGLEF